MYSNTDGQKGSFTCLSHGWVRVKAATAGSSALPECRLCLCSGEGTWLATGCTCLWDLSAFLRAQQRRKGTRRRTRHVAASRQLIRVTLLRDCRMSAAGQILLPQCKILYQSLQTLQAVVGATARCFPSALAMCCFFGCSHVKQTGTNGLFWRPPCSKYPLPGSVWENSILSSCNRRFCLAGRCSPALCLHSDYLPSWRCPGMPAHWGQTQWFPFFWQACCCPPGEPSSPPLCPVPFLKGQGKFGSRDLTIFLAVPSLSLTPFPPFPGAPETPAAIYMQLFFVDCFLSGSWEREEQRRCMSLNKQLPIFIFPIAECCTEHAESLSNQEAQEMSQLSVFLPLHSYTSRAIPNWNVHLQCAEWNILVHWSPPSNTERIILQWMLQDLSLRRAPGALHGMELHTSSHNSASCGTYSSRLCGTPTSAQPTPVSQWGTARNTLEISKDQRDCEKTDSLQKPSEMTTLCYILCALKESERKPQGLHEQIEPNRLFKKQTYQTKWWMQEAERFLSSLAFQRL